MLTPSNSSFPPKLMNVINHENNNVEAEIGDVIAEDSAVVAAFDNWANTHQEFMARSPMMRSIDRTLSTYEATHMTQSELIKTPGTGLMRAAELVKKGADWFATRGNLEVVLDRQLLVENRADIFKSKFHDALRSLDVKQLNTLLCYAEVNPKLDKSQTGASVMAELLLEVDEATGQPFFKNTFLGHTVLELLKQHEGDQEFQFQFMSNVRVLESKIANGEDDLVFEFAKQNPELAGRAIGMCIDTINKPELAMRIMAALPQDIKGNVLLDVARRVPEILGKMDHLARHVVKEKGIPNLTQQEKNEILKIGAHADNPRLVASMLDNGALLPQNQHRVIPLIHSLISEKCNDVVELLVDRFPQLANVVHPVDRETVAMRLNRRRNADEKTDDDELNPF